MYTIEVCLVCLDCCHGSITGIPATCTFGLVPSTPVLLLGGVL